MKAVFERILPAFLCLISMNLIAQVAPPPAHRPNRASKEPDAAAAAARRISSKDKEVEKEIKIGEDEAGCKDSSLLTRIAGCSIIQCDAKDVDDLEIQVGMSQDGSIQKESMDGQAEIIYYLCPIKTTPLHIAKLSEAALTRAGFKIVYNGKDGEDFPLVTGLKETQWIQISTYLYNDHAAYIQTALKVPAENQATAEALSEEMTKNGRVVLSGINFQEDVITPDSEKVLVDVAAFLVRQPDWRIRVEAHADAKPGERAAAGTLSTKRASAVATWLLEHGIDRTRLSIQGIAEESAETGGKGSRIELVRF